jgi:hypothetical protein
VTKQVIERVRSLGPAHRMVKDYAAPGTAG